VGKDGVITVEDGKKTHHEVDFFEGLKIDSGFMHKELITNSQSSSCELEEALILLANLKVDTVTEIMTFLDEAMARKLPILIICEDMDPEILATLIQNKKNGSLRFCVVKAPGFGEARKNLLEDVAILTGARVLD
jgi:chaperonin GroEL